MIKNLILFIFIFPQFCLCQSKLRIQPGPVHSIMNSLDDRSTAKDTAKTISLLTHHAKSGNTFAMIDLGIIFKNQNKLKPAIHNFLNATKKGNTDGLYQLGLVYKNLTTDSQHLNKAYNYFRKGAELNNLLCTYGMAYMTFKGYGCLQNYSTAAKLFKYCAIRKQVNSMYFYGLCLRNGYGIEKDESEAIAWFKKARAQGCIDAFREISSPNSSISHPEMIVGKKSQYSIASETPKKEPSKLKALIPAPGPHNRFWSWLQDFSSELSNPISNFLSLIDEYFNRKIERNDFARININWILDYNKKIVYYQHDTLDLRQQDFDDKTFYFYTDVETLWTSFISNDPYDPFGDPKNPIETEDVKLIDNGFQVLDIVSDSDSNRKIKNVQPPSSHKIKITLNTVYLKNKSAKKLQIGNKQVTYNTEFVLVNNFDETIKCKELIDSYGRKFYPKRASYDTYEIQFYKISDSTNLLNFKNNTDLINSYTAKHDKIYVYYWANGKFSDRTKIRDGEMIEPGIRSPAKYAL